MNTQLVPIPDLEHTIEIAYRLFEDGVRRWRDLDIAEWLGFENPAQIRELINRNRSELERHGVIREIRITSGPGGGRPSTENWLNFGGAMVVCTLSRTSRAEDVRFVMIKVFTRVVEGISTAPRMELRALEVCADRIVKPILHEQKEFHGKVIERMDRTDHCVGELRDAQVILAKDVAEIKIKVGTDRIEVREKDRDAINGTCIEFYKGGMCCCCEQVRIIDEKGDELPEYTIDHWNGRSDRRLEWIWPVCRSCNQRLFNDPRYKTENTAGLYIFQKRVKLWQKELKAKVEAAKPQLKLDFKK